MNSISDRIAEITAVSHLLLDTRATAAADKVAQALLAKAFKGELVPTEAEVAGAEGRAYKSAAARLERVGRERDKAGVTTSHHRAGRTVAQSQWRTGRTTAQMPESNWANGRPLGR